MPYERVSTSKQSPSQQANDGVAPSNVRVESNPSQSRRNRGAPDLQRAHKTLTSSFEAPAGAPRSGSA